ncbi:MAG TPA: hypothetical protein PKD54_08800 [Pirellulaceae bacterium]|nr:hypothetical protein [Pirellulaceae bacterium]
MHTDDSQIDGQVDLAAEADRLLFDPHQLIQALEQFARGLWTIFVGICLMLASALSLYLGFFRNGAPLRLAVVFIVAAIVGFFMTLLGKQKAFSFSAPLKYRRYLVWSYVCDWVGLLIRVFRNHLPGIHLIEVISIALGVFSIWFLLRFIYHLATLIEARWAQRMAWFCQVALLAMVAAGIMLAAGGAVPLIAPLAPLLATFVVTTGLAGAATTMVLLATMSFALKSFSLFLKREMSAADGEAELVPGV